MGLREAKLYEVQVTGYRIQDAGMIAPGQSNPKPMLKLRLAGQRGKISKASTTPRLRRAGRGKSRNEVNGLQPWG
ncbi:MAG: hypothetical protein GVY20_07030 [Bacteroidetes bacterium]|jgi:hypothetical protein|nr:hypothetical protein [Bacteroidota bacterium]